MDPALLTTYGALLLAGLAGSLHCVGMCGPILIGFSQAFSARPPGATAARSLAMDFAWYHAGRIWTYGLLGAGAGFLGQGIREGSALMGWHRAAAIVLSALTILVGLVLLGVIPRINVDKHLTTCGFKRFGSAAWFRGLMKSPGALPRLMLGAIMGLLPCGLVYAVLAIVAAMPSPLHSALGMIVFGIGTLPALSAVLLASHAVPARWRAHGTKLAAVFVIATGTVMAVRSAMPHGETCGCKRFIAPSAATESPRFSVGAKTQAGDVEVAHE